MEIIQKFISEYGTAILMTILTAIAGVVGTQAKRIYEKYINDKTKKEMTKICVVAVEQLYKDLDGAAKYDKCVSNLSEMLAEKGITVTELEIKMLIEAAVGTAKDVFNNCSSG